MKIVRFLSHAPAWICVACLAGCAGSGKPAPKPTAAAPSSSQLSPEDITRIKGDLRTLADTYMNRIVDACTAIESASTDPVIRQRVRTTRIGQLSAAMACGAGSKPLVSLLDLAAQVKIKRAAIERDEMVAFGETFRPLLVATQASESDVWAKLEEVLTQQQVDEYRAAIDEWLAAHPDESMVAYVRFAQFAKIDGDSARRKGAPSNLLQLLNLDPLASLDPVTVEVRESRELAERLSYIAQRFPILIQYQADASIARVLESPQITQVIKSTTDATAIVNDLKAKIDTYPAFITQERKDAIEHVSSTATTQRAAILKDVDALIDRRQALIIEQVDRQQEKVGGHLTRVEAMVRSAQSELPQTSEAVARRLIDRVFLWSAGLVVLTGIMVIVVRRQRQRTDAAKPA